MFGKIKQEVIWASAFLYGWFSQFQINIFLLVLIISVILEILQARLQQHVNWELSDVQAGYRKGRGTRGQIANVHRIIEKATEF